MKLKENFKFALEIKHAKETDYKDNWL